MPLWTNKFNFDTFFAGQSAELVPPDVREGELAVIEIMHSSMIKDLSGLNHFMSCKIQYSVAVCCTDILYKEKYSTISNILLC